MEIVFVCAITLVLSLVAIGIMADMVHDYTGCNLP